MGKGLISILHKLEQVSSEGSIGSLAENLMEALRGNQLVAEKVGNNVKVVELLLRYNRSLLSDLLLSKNLIL